MGWGVGDGDTFVKMVFFHSEVSFIVCHSLVKDSWFCGSLSRGPFRSSLETRATQPSGPGQLTGAFICFAFNYLSV